MMNSYSNRMIVKVMAIILMLCGGTLVGCNVMADDSGGGATSGSIGTDSGCSDSPRFTNNDCGDGTGGASWHIFKTTNDATTYRKVGLYKASREHGPKYCKKLEDQEKTRNCETLNVLSGGGYDFDLTTKCPKAEYPYYAVYVVDGWQGRTSSGKKDNVPTYWGPLGWGATFKGDDGKTHKMKPQTAKRMEWDNVKEKLMNKSITNGQRITPGAAKHICKLVENGKCKNYTNTKNNLPKGVGFMCINFVALTAKAVNMDGSSLESVIKDKTSGLGNSGEDFSITRRTATGYTFKGWRTEPTGAILSTDATYSVKKMLEDTTVYAVYEMGDNCVGCQCDNSCDDTDDLCLNWGSVTPGTTTTVSKVRNATVASYSEWSESVYAKPTDKIYWHHCYFPGVQTMAFELATPSGVHVNNSTHAETPSSCSEWSSSCSSLSSYEFTNMMLSSGVFGTWTNKFSIGSGSDKGSYSSTYNGQSRSFPTGDSTAQSFDEPNNSNVRFSDVGATLNEKITTGSPIGASTNNQGPYSWSCDWGYQGEKVHHYTPTYSCKCKTDEETGSTSCETCGGDPVYQSYYGWTSTCSHNTDFISNTIDKNTTSTKADVLIPYNFESNTNVKNEDGDIVFAGEPYTIDFDIIIDPRDNETLGNDAPYATKVDGAKSRIKVCPEDMECEFTSYTNESSLSGHTTQSDFENGYEVTGTPTSIVIPDIPAGKEVCVQSQVYPVDSHDDLNLSTSAYPEGDEDSWAQSDFVCFIVAKRPGLQAWGGNVFSQNQISTDIASKKHIGGESWNPSNGGGNTMRLFGSWGELGVFSNGKITGFASGASLGYENGSSPAFQNWNWSPLLNPTGAVGGSTTNIGDVCSRNRLTFSNADAFSKRCNSSSIGGMRSTSNVSKIQNDKSSIINILASSSSANMISGDSNTINGLTTNEPYVVQMYKYNNTLTINGDVIYDGIYDSFEKIPKIVFYAKNIDISCNVNRIDALVIAENVVDTCYESYDANDEARARQLRVNGAIITSQLDAKRTYGAGPGVNSGIAAEIIDFDPSLYSFGSGITDTSEDNVAGRLDVTYIHELAPRK